MEEAKTIRGHEAISKHVFDVLRTMTPPGVELVLPSPAVLEIATEYLEYTEYKSLKARFVFDRKHTQPLGIVQGGFFSVMFDNLIGPLGYLAARGPATSLSLATQFLRPVMPGQPVITTADVRRTGRQALYIQAEAFDAAGKLLATADSHVLVLAGSKPG